MNKIRSSFGKLLGVVNYVTKVVTGCLSKTKVAIFEAGDYIKHILFCQS